MDCGKTTPALLADPNASILAPMNSRFPPLIALLPWILAACSGGDSAQRPEVPAGNAKSIILITLDTVRADHMSVYGYELPTTPQLERFAEGATLFTHAHAAAPWTLPSHASLMTGLYPFEHGARTYDLEEGAKSNVQGLDSTYLTLADAFSRSGYRTAGIASNMAYLSEHFRINQGFEHYEVKPGRVDEVNRRALEWIDEQQGAPFFLFLNYMDAHGPYNSGPSANFSDLGEVVPSNDIVRGLYPIICGSAALIPADKIQNLLAQYDRSLANLDIGLGQLFDALRERKLFDPSLIVITSDHGEYFGEHRLIAHSKDVYEGAMGIPLLVKAPGQKSAVLDSELISHVHIPGLILEHAPLLALDGAELAPLRCHWPRAAILGENYYSRMLDLKSSWGKRFERVRRAIYVGSYKYIESSDGQHELYDLATDPMEQLNLIESQPERASKMSAILRAKGTIDSNASANAEDIEVDEEVLDDLKALGY